MTTIVGLFNNLESAANVYREFQNSGFSEDEISLLGRYEIVCGPDSNEIAIATATGGTGGAVIGGLVGTAIGLSAIAVPGLGTLAVSGGLATLLASAAAGAGIGGAGGGLLFNELIKLNIPEHEAELYEAGVNCGSVLVAVDAKIAQIPKVYHIFEANEADNIDFIKGMWVKSKWQAFNEKIDPDEGDYQHVEELDALS